MKNLRIIVCTYGLSIGGAERQWIYLASALARAGHSPFLMTYIAQNAEEASYLPLIKALPELNYIDASVYDKADPFQTDRLPDHIHLNVKELNILAKLGAVFHHIRPDAIITQLDGPNVLAGLAAQLCGHIKVVSSFRAHNPEEWGGNLRPWTLPGYRYLSRCNHVKFTANSRSGAASYAKWIGMPQSEITVIQNMLAPFPENALGPKSVGNIRSELGLNAEDLLLIGVFRLHPVKRVELFAEAAKILLRRFENLTIAVVGDGDERLKLEHLISGYESRFHLLGKREDVFDIMRASRLLMHTSKAEGMCNVVMEAQSFGLPIVAFDIEGMAESVAVGKSALLVRNGDIQALAEAGTQILSNPILRAEMSGAGLAYASTQFEPSEIVNQYINVIKSF